MASGVGRGAWGVGRRAAEVLLIEAHRVEPYGCVSAGGGGEVACPAAESLEDMLHRVRGRVRAQG